jgi:hypothetical protein
MIPSFDYRRCSGHAAHIIERANRTTQKRGEHRFEHTGQPSKQIRAIRV